MKQCRAGLILDRPERNVSESEGHLTGATYFWDIVVLTERLEMSIELADTVFVCLVC